MLVDFKCQEQEPAHPPLQHHEGEEGEPGDQDVQQAGCPWVLLHLERQTFTRLEQRRLPGCLRAGNHSSSPHTPPHALGTLSPLPSEALQGHQHSPSASPLLPATEGP